MNVHRPYKSILCAASLVICFLNYAAAQTPAPSSAPSSTTSQTSSPTPLPTPLPTSPPRASAVQTIANESDVASVDAILATLYDVISGEQAKPRDWARMRSLFLPDARLMPLRALKAGGYAASYLTVDDYITSATPLFARQGFFERETHRVTEQFGNLVHVFSTYEARRDAADKKAFARGINSIQLMNDGKRWWVVNLAWEAERPGLSLPDKYLSKNK